MKSLQSQSDNQRTNSASDQLAGNAEHLAWRSHQLAVEIADNDPNAVSFALCRAATEQWRRVYLDLPE